MAALVTLTDVVRALAETPKRDREAMMRDIVSVLLFEAATYPRGANLTIHWPPEAKAA